MSIKEKLQSFFSKMFLLPGQKQTKRFIDEIMAKFRFIDILENGFQIKDKSNVIERTLIWTEVVDSTYSPEQLTFQLTDGKTIVIPQVYYENWHALLKEIPQGYKSFDYNAVNQYFASLKGCAICGLMAVGEENECLACGYDVWNPELESELGSQEDYLKQAQFENFLPANEHTPIAINNNPAFGFESFDGWIPYITESEYN